MGHVFASIAAAVIGIIAGLCTIFCAIMAHATGHADVRPEPTPIIIQPAAPVIVPAPAPTKPDANRNRKPLLPWRASTPPTGATRPPNATIGGLTSPDGTETIAIDLPPSMRLKNVGGRDGAGLCVFTSGNHAAYWQSVTCLYDFQKRMRAKPGGGYPDKVDKCLKEFCPAIDGKYLQNTESTLAFLRDVIDSGRMPCITYDGSLDPHYGFKHVEHMTNLWHLSDKWAAVFDNNFIGDQQVVWMSPAALEWMHTSGLTRKGWSWVFLAPGPLPLPRNGGE